MPSRWHLSLISLFIIASFFGVVFLIYRSVNDLSDCASKDKRICRTLNSLKNEKIKEGEGTYTKDSQNMNTQFFWKVKDDTSEMIVSRNKKELIHVFSKRNNLYIQDLGKVSWLRQSLSDRSEVEKKLPFQLYEYFQSITAFILKPGNSFKYIDSSQCGVNTCYRYQIKASSVEDKQQFIYVTEEGKLISYHSASAEEKEEFGITKMKTQITLPQKYEQVDSGRNIVLEIMTQAEEESANYDYVKQFERQRQQNESKAK